MSVLYSAFAQRPRRHLTVWGSSHPVSDPVMYEYLVNINVIVPCLVEVPGPASLPAASPHGRQREGTSDAALASLRAAVTPRTPASVPTMLQHDSELRPTRGGTRMDVGNARHSMHHGMPRWASGPWVKPQFQHPLARSRYPGRSTGRPQPVSRASRSSCRPSPRDRPWSLSMPDDDGEDGFPY